MPPRLRQDLIDAIDAIYRSRLVAINTQTTGEKHSFDSVHFSYFNRFSKRVGHPLCHLFRFDCHQGDGIPTNQDPADVLPDRRRANTAWFVPWAGKELEDHIEEYQLLQETLEPVFLWIQSLVSVSFPFYSIQVL